jgi:hypothetical protein
MGSTLMMIQKKAMMCPVGEERKNSNKEKENKMSPLMLMPICLLHPT